MDWFNRLHSGSLPAFNLILCGAMAVILLTTRMGLGSAAGKLNGWLIGILLLLSARAYVPAVDAINTALGKEIDGSDIVFPLVLIGLFWQAEAMRALHLGRNAGRAWLLGGSVTVGTVAYAVQVHVGQWGLPALVAMISIWLVWNAIPLAKNSWGGRLLTAAAMSMLLLNVQQISSFDDSPDQTARRVLLLEMLWTLLSTAGFLQHLYQDIREKLESIAVTDTLTGVFNRTGFVPLLNREIERAKRQGSLSLILCDLDHFKRINDTHGHPVGDQVLRRFVSLARPCLRATDLLGRWGGEEFVIALSDSTVEEAVAVTERIRQAVADSSESPGFTFSAGVAGAAEAQVHFDPERLLMVADKRLYLAKGKRDTSVWQDVADASSLAL